MTAFMSLYLYTKCTQTIQSTYSVMQSCSAERPYCKHANKTKGFPSK